MCLCVRRACVDNDLRGLNFFFTAAFKLLAVDFSNNIRMRVIASVAHRGDIDIQLQFNQKPDLSKPSQFESRGLVFLFENF